MDSDFWTNIRVYPMNPRGMTASQVGYIRDIIWDVMHRNVTTDYLKVVPENEDAVVVVCTYKSTYVGCCILRMKQDTSYLESLCVRENFRRHGLAREIINVCKDYVKSNTDVNKIPTITLHVDKIADNLRQAQQLKQYYEKHDFHCSLEIEKEIELRWQYTP